MNTKKELQAGDLTGLGAAMNAIPEAGWQKLVDTACDTFITLLAPVTATTGGIGRLIQAKFEKLSDPEKVLVSATLYNAETKARNVAKKPAARRATPTPRTLVHFLESNASNVDRDIHELWANLLAQEMLGKQTHPDILRILQSLCSEDAQLLVAIINDTPKGTGALLARSLRVAFVSTPLSIPLKRAENSFSHAKLQNSELIHRIETEWLATALGRSFLEAVSDPSLDSDE